MGHCKASGNSFRSVVGWSYPHPGIAGQQKSPELATPSSGGSRHAPVGAHHGRECDSVTVGTAVAHPGNASRPGAAVQPKRSAGCQRIRSRIHWAIRLRFGTQRGVPPWGENSLLFISYAEEDRAIAGAIATRLKAEGFDLFDWLAAEQRGRQFSREIEKAITSADAFIVVLSPSYLASQWCQKEWHLAHSREVRLHRHQPDRMFIHVAWVADIPQDRELGFISGYDWGDIVDSENITATTGPMVKRIMANSGVQVAANSSASIPEYAMKFRNRTSELDNVLLGLGSFSGPHFWLVTAPPHLGKSWFIKELQSKLTDWGSELVDLQREPELRADPDALIERLFCLTTPLTDWSKDALAIARKISGSRKPYLCLVDSAELIDPKTAYVLRSRLGEIYDLLQGKFKNNVRLALVVASRRDAGWLGVTPNPRLTPLSLSEFSLTVVRQALFDLAEGMEVDLNAFEFHTIAAQVHKATEGLPALLLECMRWIEAQEWFELEQLTEQSYFEELVGPFVTGNLLSYEGLFPGVHNADDETKLLKSRVVVRAYRALAPYRLFTQSHLRHHLQKDDEVCDTIGQLNWSLEDLWNAVSDSALLLRPLDEPWQEMHPAIRRLLYRYFYSTPQERAAVHEQAREFVAIWGERQLGKEQTIGLIECLWHEAMALLGTGREEFKRQLMPSAADLSGGLKPSPLYTVEELRHYTSGRMRADSELSDAFNEVAGFFQTLIEIVEKPAIAAGDLT